MGMGERLERAAGQRLQRERQRLVRLSGSRMMTDPRSYFQDKRLLLDYQSRRLVHGMENTVSARREQFGRLAAALDALSPLKVLGRGYAIARKEDGRVISSVGDAAPGEGFSLRLSDGELKCRVAESQERGRSGSCSC